MPESVLRIGLCGVGLEAYWPQFEGLHARLKGYVQQVEVRLKESGAQVEFLGLIDTPQLGREAGHACRRSDVDLLVIYVTTYALSNTVLPLVQRAKVPVLVLNLQPEAAIDYEAFNKLPNRTAMTAEWLAYCSACPMPEIANVLLRAEIPFHQVTGVLDDPSTWVEIDEWIAAAKVQRVLSNNRLGLLGHYYSGMLDIQTDITRVSIVFGTHLEHLEVDELSALRSEIDDEAILQRVKYFEEYFDVDPECAQAELQRAACTSVALDCLVDRHDLNSLAYFYKGTGVGVNEDTMSSIILGTSLLTARGIAVAGEYEIKNVLAMKIMDAFGAGGSFSECYAVDLKADDVIMGHDGPGHLAIAESKVKVRPLQVYHGKVGRGVSVEMSVKHGPVTLLSVVENSQRGFKLVAAEAECVPGEILKIGNTNSHYRFSIGARRFIESWNVEGPAHHCAIGVGHVSRKLSKLARLLQIPFVQVC
jgi:L-arabinose isomerase